MKQEMPPERWERAREILAEALERDEARRDTYLTYACAGDAELRAEIDSLLAAHAGRGAVDQIADAVSRVIVASDEHLIGRRVGPYRLTRVINQGGMGTVFLAEREDGQFEQRVALKLIRMGMHSEAVVRRFLDERRILARLEHLNIARLLDGGIAESGQPYFAMEYVEGVSITQYCSQHGLDVDRRLQLFQQVCAAVQYAHQSLIVHRDLKPSNILVTADGTVKLLDFGIAKLLGPDANADARTTTMHWLTPDYAAPEQIRGEAITTATDIYALALLLYELLSGQRAFLNPGGSRTELERMICEVDPAPPSSVVTRSQLRRQLTGDLDTIVLQALRKEPARRYASAGQLSEDVQRYRSGLPVHARPDTLAYRTSKFVQRHSAGVGAAALVMITLLGGIAATSWQARAATEERDRAREEAAKAEQVSAFVIDLFRAAEPRETGGDTITARHLLERGVAQLEGQLSQQPLVRAAMLDVIGRVYRNLGRYDQAKKVWLEAVDLRRAQVGPRHSDVAASLMRLGLLHHQIAQYKEAEVFLTEALAIWKDRVDGESDEVATALSNLGDIQLTRRQPEQAVALYQRALDMRRRVLGPENPAVANDLTSLGTVYLHTEPARADSLFTQALAMQKKVLPADHSDIVRTMDGLAAVRLRLGAYDDAEAFYREVLALRRRTIGPDHPEVAFSLDGLAAVQEKKGNLFEAEQLFRQSLELRRKTFGGVALLSRPLTNLGRVLQARGRCAEARPLLREALDIRQRSAMKSQSQIDELQKMLAACPS
jgi:serine/threonine protein kinase